MNNLDYLIANYKQIIVLLLAIAIFVRFTAPSLEQIRKLVLGLAKLFVKEFTDETKIPPQKINLTMWIGILLLTLVIVVKSGVQSMVLGLLTGQNIDADRLLCYFAFFLFVVTVGSPLWLLYMDRERQMREKVRSTLEK